MVGNSSFERMENDFYPTIDNNVTKILLKTLDERGLLFDTDTVWEPAAGAGHMMDVIKEQCNVFGSDIISRREDIETFDFLDIKKSDTIFDEAIVDAIITNPPFGKTLDAFIERGLKFVERKNITMAFLARNELDCAVSRDKFFGQCKYFWGKVVLTWRPRWFEKDYGSAAPRHNYSWYIWTHNQKHNEDKFLIYGYKKDL